MSFESSRRSTNASSNDFVNFLSSNRFIILKRSMRSTNASSNGLENWRQYGNAACPTQVQKLKTSNLTAPIFLVCPPFQMMIIMLYQQGIPLADTLLESRILPNLYAVQAKLQILVLFSQVKKWADFKTGQVHSAYFSDSKDSQIHFRMKQRRQQIIGYPDQQ